MVLYTFLHWFLVMKLNLLSPSRLLVTIALPVLLCWIPALIFINLRINLLSLYQTRGNVPMLYFLIAAFGLCIPTIFAQQYLITAVGKLNYLKTIDDVRSKLPEKYFNVKSYFVDKENASWYSNSNLSGWHNDTLNVSVYFICPIYNGKNNPVELPRLWFGVKYQIQMPNGLRSDIKEDRTQDFYKDSQKMFQDKDFRNFNYFEQINEGRSYGGYLAAVNNGYGLKLKDILVFEGKFEPFESRSGDKLWWVILSYILFSFVWGVVISIPDIETNIFQDQLN